MMLREEICEKLNIPLIELDQQIVIDSIEKAAAMRITHVAEVEFGRGDEKTLETFAVTKLPPGPDAILDQGWIRRRCPGAIESMENYGIRPKEDSNMEEPIAARPCKDPKVAFSMGGGDFDIDLHTRVMMAIEAEEERREQLTRDCLLQLQEVHLFKEARAHIRVALKHHEDQDDSGYESNNEDDDEPPRIPAPPIRGLKKNPIGWEKLIPYKWAEPFLDVFEDVKPGDKPVSIPGFNCEIKLKDGETLTTSKLYAMSRDEFAAVDKILEHEIALGITRLSKAPHAVPSFFVRDPASEGRNDGMRQLRLVKDYRPLNSKIIMDSYPIPLTRPAIQRLSRAKRIIIWDAKSGYDLVPVEESSIPLTAWNCERGQFESTRMPQGLATAPAIFQRRMQYILREFVNKPDNGCFVYLDDIVVYAEDDASMEKVAVGILKALRKGGVKLSPTKAQWSGERFNFLGYTIVLGKGVCMSHDKAVMLKESRPPKNVADVRKLQGQFNFYGHLIPHFADKSACITDLLKAGTPWDWNQERQRAWKAMCDSIIEDRYYQGFDFDLPVTMSTDASDRAFGIVIKQPMTSDPSQLALVYCAHHKFTKEEQGWQIADKELFAIVYAFREFRDILAAPRYPIRIQSDHRNLAKWMLGTSDLSSHNGRTGRWYEELADKPFTIEYTPPTHPDMEEADFLSRYGYPDSADHQNQVILPLERFSTKALSDISEWLKRTANSINIREKLETTHGFAKKKIHALIGAIGSKLNDSADPVPQTPDEPALARAYLISSRIRKRMLAAAGADLDSILPRPEQVRTKDDRRGLGAVPGRHGQGGMDWVQGPIV